MPCTARFVLLALLALCPAAGAEDAGCIECHARLVQARVVHAPLQTGCGACHAALDAASTPHRSSAPGANALKAAPAALCADCHEAALFEGKVVHGALLAGSCETCHDPHGSPYQGLLKKEPARLCLECHPEVARRPHVVAGIRRGSHPIGIEGKAVRDPTRPGKTFYCVACHEPHRAETPKLTRFGTDTASCRQCHRI